MTPKLAYAHAYVERGWLVFVLSASKVPLRNCGPCHDEHVTSEQMTACDCLTCHGFYAATADPDRVKAMLDQHPDGCLAIRTGAASGIAVVDVDFHTLNDHGEPAATDPAYRTLRRLDEAGVLPGTVTQETGAGGLHLVYAHPGGYVKSGPALLGPGVDSKADGGYIVAAPSVHPRSRRPYRWAGDGRFDHDLPQLHAALADRLRPEPPPARLAAARPHTTRGRLAGLLNTVLTAPDGQRNAVLHWAACRAAELVTAGDVDETTAAAALEDAGAAIGLTPGEVRRTVRSGLRTAAAA